MYFSHLVIDLVNNFCVLQIHNPFTGLIKAEFCLDVCSFQETGDPFTPLTPLGNSRYFTKLWSLLLLIHGHDYFESKQVFYSEIILKKNNFLCKISQTKGDADDARWHTHLRRQELLITLT